MRYTAPTPWNIYSLSPTKAEAKAKKVKTGSLVISAASSPSLHTHAALLFFFSCITVSVYWIITQKKMSGPQCCENPPALSSSSGGGSVVQLGGLKSYVSGPSDSKLAILLVSDVFGYEAPKLRKLADKIAAAGFFVVVPDFFDGDVYDPANSEKPLPVWIKLHEPDKVTEDAKPVIADLKSKGITAIGAAGFCWGAKVVVRLATSDHVQAAVLLHPSFVSIDDIKEVKKPIAILGAEIDKMSPPELIKQFEEILSSKPEVDSFVKIFPGVSHGWSVRYDEADEKAVKSAEEAHQDKLNWFVKYVK